MLKTVLFIGPLVVLLAAACGDSEEQQASPSPTTTALESITPAPSPLPTATPSPAPQTYHNEKYGYQVTVPPGWRVASVYMQALAEVMSNPRFAAGPDDYAVQTSLSEDAERRFVDQASNEVGLALGPWYKFAIGQSVQIRPVASDEGDFLADVNQGGLTIANSDVRDVMLDSGEMAVRVNRREASDNGDYTYDAVYIPFTSQGCAPDGICQGMVIQIAKSCVCIEPSGTTYVEHGYDIAAFETIFRSFSLD